VIYALETSCVLLVFWSAFQELTEQHWIVALWPCELNIHTAKRWCLTSQSMVLEGARSFRFVSWLGRVALLIELFWRSRWVFNALLVSKLPLPRPKLQIAIDFYTLREGEPTVVTIRVSCTKLQLDGRCCSQSTSWRDFRVLQHCIARTFLQHALR